MANISIKLINISEIDSVMEIISDAILLLGKDSLQWQQGYPNKDTMIADINNQNLFGYYLNDYLVGIVALVRGIDINYTKIYQGSWKVLPNENDLTIHRIAVRNLYHQQKIGESLIKFGITKAKDDNNIKSVKLDTHIKNIAMQKIALKNGFKYRGVIYIKRDEKDNSRLAYELVV